MKKLFFSKQDFLIFLLTVFFIAPSFLKAQEAQPTQTIVLHQADGSFKEQSDKTSLKPAPIIEIPLGSHIQIELQGPERVTTQSNNFIFRTEWTFDDNFASEWNDFLKQNNSIQLPPPSNIEDDDGCFSKTFIFNFDAVKTGQAVLHFEKRQTDSADNFKPHGYDNLYFDIHIVDPEELKNQHLQEKTGSRDSDQEAQPTQTIVLHQADGSFKEQSDKTSLKPAPIIEIPLGSHIQIELQGPERVTTQSNNFIFRTEWTFDDNFASEWNDFLKQNNSIQLPPPSNIEDDDGCFSKTFIFNFDAVKTGQAVLHFEKRQTDSADNFKPHGYDNLYFDIHIVDPEELKNQKDVFTL
ncbi:MAG: hypothetical protein ACOYK6_06140 [Chthoniobacterales bacterium]